MNLITKPSKGYCQVAQYSSTTFTFATHTEDTITELFYPVMCRDFLNECVYNIVTNSNCEEIYYFKAPQQKEFDLNFVNLVIHGKAEELSSIKACIHRLNVVEQNAGFKYCTTCFEYEHKGEPYLHILGPKEWQQHPWMISLYTFLLRLYSYPVVSQTSWTEYSDLLKVLPQRKPDSWNDSYKEHSYLTRISSYNGSLNVLLDNLRGVLDAADPKVDISGYLEDRNAGIGYPIQIGFKHNYTGFLSVLFSNNSYKNVFKERFHALSKLQHTADAV